MNKRCHGCGVLLQIDKPELIGYIEPAMYEKANICRRCFRLRFYGDYIYVNKSNEDYEDMLKSISSTGDLVLFTVDMFNVDDELIYVDRMLNNPMILVLTKRDLLPKSVKDRKIIDYIKKYNLDVVDIVAISSETNYNIDYLFKLINKYKKSNNVYIVGNTNAGKSSLINKMIKKYSNSNLYITTSLLPTTTLDLMEIKLNDKLTIIDTPGLIEDGNVANHYDYMTLKRILPKNEIRPRTYQLDSNRSLMLENIARVDYEEGPVNSFTFFISNELNIENVKFGQEIKIANYKKYTFDVNSNEDIVISGLGWIKIVKDGVVSVIVNDKVKVFKREGII